MMHVEGFAGHRHRLAIAEQNTGFRIQREGTECVARHCYQPVEITAKKILERVENI